MTVNPVIRAKSKDCAHGRGARDGVAQQDAYYSAYHDDAHASAKGQLNSGRSLLVANGLGVTWVLRAERSAEGERRRGNWQRKEYKTGRTAAIEAQK